MFTKPMRTLGNSTKICIKGSDYRRMELENSTMILFHDVAESKGFYYYDRFAPLIGYDPKTDEYVFFAWKSTWFEKLTAQLRYLFLRMMGAKNVPW